MLQDCFAGDLVIIALIATFLPKSFRSVVNGEHGAHVGQQRLGRANVGSGFVSSDVLFSRLQRQSECVVALSVSRDADHSSRHHAHQLLRDGEESGVRTAITERNAETLSVAEGDVETEFTC